MTTIDRAPVRTIDRTTARRAGGALALASGLAIAGFTVLGSVFEYPQILEEPTADILALFREHRGSVMGWFLVLTVSAALMAPAGIWLGRIADGRLGRWIAGVGIAVATVQVVGLQRWVTLVPGISDDALDPALRPDAEDRFELLHTVLGKAIGETLGYALTATFTVLVVDGPEQDRAAALARHHRLRRRRAHRHRRGDPDRRGREPHQLRGVRRLVRLEEQGRQRLDPEVEGARPAVIGAVGAEVEAEADQCDDGGSGPSSGSERPRRRPSTPCSRTAMPTSAPTRNWGSRPGSSDADIPVPRPRVPPPDRQGAGRGQQGPTGERRCRSGASSGTSR